MAFFKKKKYLRYDEFRLFSVGPKAERKRFTRFNQDAADIGFVIDGELIARHPELLYGWPAEAGAPPRRLILPGRSPWRSSRMSITKRRGPISPARSGA